MKRALHTLLLLVTLAVATIAQTSQQGRIFNVRQYGAKCDGATDDTAAMQRVLTLAAAGGTMYIPDGTCLTDPLTTSGNTFTIAGNGWGSIIKSRTNGTLLTFDNSATTTHSITIRDIALQGFGSGSGNNGVVISGANERFNWLLSNVKMSAFGGTTFLSSGGALFTSSWTDLDLDQPSGASGHCFDVNGAQTNSMKRVYVHNVATGKTAYRLRQGAWQLESVNGIDSGTTATWAIFGQQTSIDGTDSYAQVNFQTCNIEDWSDTIGVEFRIGSFGSFFNTKFNTKSSGTYIAIQLNFIDVGNAGIYDALSSFDLEGTAAWSNGQPVHSWNPPFVQVGGQDFSNYYDSNLAATVPLAAVKTGLVGSKGTVQMDRAELGTGSDQGLASHLRFSESATFDIGKSDFTQSPQNAYFNNSIVMANGTTTVGGQRWTITGGTNPILNLDDGTVAGRVQLIGGSQFQVGTSSAHSMKFLTSGVERWTMDSSGNLYVESGTLNIGKAAGNRPTIGYFNTSVNVGIPGSGNGSFVMGNATNSNTLTLSGGVTTTSYTWRFPLAAPASTQCLQIDSSGNVSATGSSCGGGGGSQTPWTSDIDAAGFNLLVTDSTGIKSNETSNPSLLLFTSVASAVNYMTLTNAATGSGPSLAAAGTDTNIPITLTPKGTGQLLLNQNGTTSTPAFSFTGATNVGFSNANSALQFIYSGTNSWAIGSNGSKTSSNGRVDWSSDSSTSGTTDLALSRFAANTLRVGGDTAGSTAGKLFVSRSDKTMTGYFTVDGDLSNTTSVGDVGSLGADSTGTAGAGFGARLILSLENSTTNQQQAGSLIWKWNVATAGSEESYVAIGTNRNGSLADVFMVSADQYYGIRSTQNITGSSQVINWNNGNIIEATLTGNVTSLSFSGLKNGAMYTLVFKQDGTGGRTLSVPSTLKVPGGSYTVTTNASARDVLQCYSDGTNLYCNPAFDVK